MRVSGQFAMRLTRQLGLALATLLPAAPVAALDSSADAPQLVIMLSGRSLIERRLPAFVEVAPGKFLDASVLKRACSSPALRVDSVLLFLPARQTCERVSVSEQKVLRQRLHKLTGRWEARDPLARLHEQAIVAMTPAPASNLRANAPCTCTAPDGVAMCATQARTVGTAIATVEYLATDADGDALTGAFSYQFNADPIVDGLPPSLTPSCTPAPGSLQCTINGTAPAQPGSLQLMLKVTDGITPPDLQLSSLLQVLATDDRVFAGGFEASGTLSCTD